MIVAFFRWAQFWLWAGNNKELGDDANDDEGLWSVVLTDLIIGTGANNTGFALNIAELVCIITISIVAQILGVMEGRRNCWRLTQGEEEEDDRTIVFVLFCFHLFLGFGLI